MTITVGSLIKELQKHPNENKIVITSDSGDTLHDFALRDVSLPVESDITDIVVIYTERIVKPI